MEIERAEVYEFKHPDLDYSFWWDVSKAKFHVQQGHVEEVIVVPVDDVIQLVEQHQIDWGYVGQADASQPGIAAPVLSPDGDVYYFVIDGHHRAARTLFAGTQFWVSLLTDEAALDVQIGKHDSFWQAPA